MAHIGPTMAVDYSTTCWQHHSYSHNLIDKVWQRKQNCNQHPQTQSLRQWVAIPCCKRKTWRSDIIENTQCVTLHDRHLLTSAVKTCQAGTQQQSVIAQYRYDGKQVLWKVEETQWFSQGTNDTLLKHKNSFANLQWLQYWLDSRNTQKQGEIKQSSRKEVTPENTSMTACMAHWTHKQWLSFRTGIWLWFARGALKTPFDVVAIYKYYISFEVSDRNETIEGLLHISKDELTQKLWAHPIAGPGIMLISGPVIGHEHRYNCRLFNAAFHMVMAQWQIQGVKSCWRVQR